MEKAKSAAASRGDAEAVLQGFVGGGWAIRLHAGPKEGGPSDAGPDSPVAIRPLSAWAGRRYRAEDWKVILLALIEGGDKFFTRATAQNLLDPVEVDFDLDGSGLPTTRTAIKRFLNPDLFGWDEAYAFQEGRVMAPDELSVGEHSLGVRISHPDLGVTYENSITFFVDPPPVA